MRCPRCLYDSTIPGFRIEDDGTCNYCHIHNELCKQHPTGQDGKFKLFAIFDEIKEKGKNKPFDCVVGVSGGRDSSYLLHLACKSGLRPIAVHYDNGWDDPIAVRNIQKMVTALEVPLVNIRVKQKEVDDLIRAFLISGTKDAEAATDLGLVKTIFMVAKMYGIKYILDGHSFRTEGMAPVGWSYMDGKYVKSVHDKFGMVPLKTYPALTLWDQLKFAASGIKRPRVLYHIDYNAEKAKEFLIENYGWEWYGGHHLENVYTAFFDYYYRYNKLGYDGRLVELSALVRSGQMYRDEALKELEKPLLPDDVEKNLLNEIKTRLRLDDKTFDLIMDKNNLKTSDDWPTYKRHFKLLKPLLWLMMKTNRIPKTFYIKYAK